MTNIYSYKLNSEIDGNTEIVIYKIRGNYITFINRKIILIIYITTFQLQL